jgi:hypothetical protein
MSFGWGPELVSRNTPLRPKRDAAWQFKLFSEGKRIFVF